jgi:formate dehydrogenase subunit gamma
MSSRRPAKADRARGEQAFAIPDPALRGRGEQPNTVERFDRLERWIHWTNAALFAVMLFTAGCLYFSPLSTLVGRRELVRTVHVYTGLALPIPILAGLVLRRAGAAFRADVRRLNRFLPDDGRWLRSLGRDRTVQLGKFNPGQKLNAAFTAGAIVVMLATGSIMRWFRPFPLAWRTGATFVHDTVFLLLVATITGHIWLARRDPNCLTGMRTGRVRATWAARHHPRWAAELAPAEPDPEPIPLGPVSDGAR